MKKIITLLLLLFTLNISAQTYPIIENFNTLGSWTANNGSGIQTYGPGLNFLTTNIGNTPYPNSSTITMTSPVYSFTNCLANLTITFPINGRIENGWDFMDFQYSTTGGAPWITLATHTGVRNNVIYNYTLSNNVNRFRFRLITDGSINSSGGTVFYYDIDYFNITCTSVLPIELIYFKGNNITTGNLIEWESATEINCSYYQLERSLDAVNWTSIATLNGAGTSTQNHKYNFLDANITPNIYYYKLTQFDFIGLSESFNIISIDVKGSDIKSIKCYNFLGQEVICNSPGIYLEITEYSNGERLVKQRIQD